MTDESIFKPYDVRGVYPGEVNEEIAEKIGRAFALKSNAKKISVAMDGRLSSKPLYDAAIKGILSQGVDVYKIGQAPTEAMYFSVGFYDDIDAGMMVTASHNPKEYNGFKMVVKSGGRIDVLRGKDLFEAAKGDIVARREGKEAEKDIWKDFSDFMLSKAGAPEGKRLKVVVDASNGVGAIAIKLMESKIPIDIISINFGIDGNFPAHSPNPLVEGSVGQISKAIKDNHADFGCIFDGDADRIFLVDEEGKLVSADITLLFLAKHFLKENPGSAVSYNVLCSKAVPQMIEEWAGVPIRTKVGFVNVREGMMNNSGVMGGELSGHYCFRDFYYFDSGMISFLTLLIVISQSGKKVSEMTQEFSKYFRADLNFEIKDKDSVLNKIKEEYGDGKQDELDGITVEYENWWFNVRPSNTEPVLRLAVEADTKELLEEKKQELTEKIARIK